MKISVHKILLLHLVLSCAACHFNTPEKSSPNSEISSEEYISVSSDTESSEVEEIYDEEPDSIEGIDVTDLSGLYSAIGNFTENYTSIIHGYFNELGAKDYYRHYQKNYVCDKTSYFTERATYTISELDEYLSICNHGFVNYNGNYYSFSLSGSSKEEMFNYRLTNEDLHDEVLNKKYQEDVFSISDLNEEYFLNNGFTRISENKYQCEDKDVCEQFISICAPDLDNTGHYLTFSRVTIETSPSIRIRLYVSSTQSGKLIDSHKDLENKPNWYLLFSEANIVDINETTFEPIASLNF